MRKWLKVAVTVATLVLLVVAGIAACRLLLGAVGLIGGGDVTTRDPMFADDPERITRPPELTEGDAVEVLEDRSGSWQTEEETPVDKTAAELAAEEGLPELTQD